MTYKRTILISGFDATVRMRNRQLLISEGTELRGSVPLDEIAMLVIDTPLTVLTNAALTELVNDGGVVALCNDKHIPAALVLPVAGNCLHAERLRLQIDTSIPIRKRMWQQIVSAKIRNQGEAAQLAGFQSLANRLLSMSEKVRSGDPENCEAQAAQLYWQAWSTDAQKFRRDPDGDAPNNLLNYGYAIVRAAVARALVAVGFHPALGLFHRGRTNAFALADDVMEPFRPFIDVKVRTLFIKEERTQLDRDTKAALLTVLTDPCQCDGHASSILNSMGHLCDSMVNFMAGRGGGRELKVPEFPDPNQLRRRPKAAWEQDDDEDDE